MQNDINQQRQKSRATQNKINQFSNMMEECVSYIQDYKGLKEHIIDIYHAFVQDTTKPQVIDMEM
jgi:hypothetical protein